ncbi:MAG TPA: deoxyribose-phosphate aldolase [bacterium]|nr:deoxyribose-phosphate aldolase [bacterium]
MDISRYIDHTLLKADATSGQVEALCREALEHGFAAVCVNPVFVDLAAGLLRDSKVGVATVVGFPLGANTTSIKTREAWEALRQGAGEIDMVMSLGLFKAGNLVAVQRDISEVVTASEGKVVKVILETCYLSPDEIAAACKLAVDAGASYVKTSTGFGSRGATVEDVKAMKAAVGERCLIKASGGIKTREAALSMIEAGASRIGTSSGVAIVKGA